MSGSEPTKTSRPSIRNGSHVLEWTVRDLQPGEVRSLVPDALDRGDRQGVAGARAELVEVEGQRCARRSRSDEVAHERLLVERVVRRPDHGHRIRPGFCGVLRQANRVRRGLRTAVDGHLNATRDRIEEEPRHSSPLLEGQQDALPRGAERENPVQPARDEEVRVGAERVLVEGRSLLPERCDSRCEHTFEHEPTLCCARMSGLRVERDGPVLRITLARPERRNAFDAELIAELTEAFGDVGDARAVLLGGDGKAFCAGADVEWQRASIDLTYEQNVEDALRLYRMLVAVDACPAPVVARIQGYCLGGGCGLAACCDIAVCGDDAVFGFSEVKLGIIPAVISPFVLAKIGSGAARRYFLTGERFGPEVALRIGLVSQVAPGLDGVVEGVVDELLASGPAAVREAKRLVRPEPPDGLELAELAARMRTSDEGQEGLRAFLDKRPPAWKSGSSS